MKIVDLARAVAPDCKIQYIGIRPGEKLHEILVSEDEIHHTLEFDNMFITEPAHLWWTTDNCRGGRRLPEGFRYSSDTNDHWLTQDELRAMIR